MSEELSHGHSNPETAFEREDLSTRGVFVFMIGLAIVGLVIYFIIVGMYTFLDKYEHSQMSVASPLAPNVNSDARFIPFDPSHGDAVTNKFKENGAPMLEHDERGQFKDYLLKQEDQLNSYGWIDKDAGVARIPIDHAMDIIVERGLPVLPSSAAAGSASASAEQSNGKPEKKK